MTAPEHITPAPNAVATRLERIRTRLTGIGFPPGPDLLDARWLVEQLDGALARVATLAAVAESNGQAYRLVAADKPVPPLDGLEGIRRRMTTTAPGGSDVRPLLDLLDQLQADTRLLLEQLARHRALNSTLAAFAEGSDRAYRSGAADLHAVRAELDRISALSIIQPREGEPANSYAAGVRWTVGLIREALERQ